jgi:hypothetical protein
MTIVVAGPQSAGCRAFVAGHAASRSDELGEVPWRPQAARRARRRQQALRLRPGARQPPSRRGPGGPVGVLRLPAGTRHVELALLVRGTDRFTVFGSTIDRRAARFTPACDTRPCPQCAVLGEHTRRRDCPPCRQHRSSPGAVRH